MESFRNILDVEKCIYREFTIVTLMGATRKEKIDSNF